MNGLDWYERLPNDHGKKGKAFNKPTHRAEKAVEWIRGNALPLALFTAGLVIA